MGNLACSTCKQVPFDNKKCVNELCDAIYCGKCAETQECSFCYWALISHPLYTNAINTFITNCRFKCDICEKEGNIAGVFSHRASCKVTCIMCKTEKNQNNIASHSECKVVFLEDTEVLAVDEHGIYEKFVCCGYIKDVRHKANHLLCHKEAISQMGIKMGELNHKKAELTQQLLTLTLEVEKLVKDQNEHLVKYNALISPTVPVSPTVNTVPGITTPVRTTRVVTIPAPPVIARQSLPFNSMLARVNIMPQIRCPGSSIEINTTSSSSTSQLALLNPQPTTPPGMISMPMFLAFPFPQMKDLTNSTMLQWVRDAAIAALKRGPLSLIDLQDAITDPANVGTINQNNVPPIIQCLSDVLKKYTDVFEAGRDGRFQLIDHASTSNKRSIESVYGPEPEKAPRKRARRSPSSSTKNKD